MEDRRGDAWVTLSRFCTRVGGATSYRYSGRPDRGRDRGQHRRHALALVTCRNLSPLNTRHGRARRLVSQHDGYSRRGAVSRCRVKKSDERVQRDAMPSLLRSKRRNAISLRCVPPGGRMAACAPCHAVSHRVTPCCPGRMAASARRCTACACRRAPRPTRRARATRSRSSCRFEGGTRARARFRTHKNRERSLARTKSALPRTPFVERPVLSFIERKEVVGKRQSC